MPLQVWPKVEPLLLLKLVVDLSQVLDGAVAQPEAVARAMIRDGRQRMRALRLGAPNLDISFSRILTWISSESTAHEHLGDDEDALQALLEMCLGLVLRWLSRRREPSQVQPSPLSSGAFRFSERRWLLCFFSLHRRSRARSCLIASPS